MAEDQADAIKTWDERAATWDQRTEAHTYAAQAFATLKPLVLEHLGDWSELRVLDFGAGTGLLLEKLAPLCRELVAVDLSPKMIEVLDKKLLHEGWSQVVTIAGELGQLQQTRPELRAPFDLIVASSVCSFLPDFAAELARLSSMLRPGGLFVQWDWHAGAASDWAGGFSREDLKVAYESAALEMISAEVGFLFSFDGSEMEVLQGIGRR